MSDHQSKINIIFIAVNITDAGSVNGSIHGTNWHIAPCMFPWATILQISVNSYWGYDYDILFSFFLYIIDIYVKVSEFLSRLSASDVG